MENFRNLSAARVAACYVIYLAWGAAFVSTTWPARRRKAAAAAAAASSASAGKGKGSSSSSSIAGDSYDHLSALRQASRLLASSVMYTLPLMIVAQQLERWSPWCEPMRMLGADPGSCEWCDPLDEAQSWLLHFQLTYYVFDTPWTMIKGDVEQLVHHTIGVPLAAVPIYAGACGVPVCFGLFSEQGLSIFVRLVKVARFYVAKHHFLDRTLIFLNWLQCGLFTPFIGVPYLLLIAYVSWRFIPAVAALIFSIATVGQAAYGLYWIKRLFKSYAIYRRQFAEKLILAKKGAHGMQARMRI